MRNVPINFSEKLALINDHWKPRIVAEMNDYQFKLVKLQGEFVWHDHPDTDETFLVLAGHLRIEIREHDIVSVIELGPGEMYVVKKGVEHRPVAEEEVQLMLIEPRGVVNTGDTEGLLTAKNDVWI